MISSSDPAACVFANKCGEVRKSVQSFKETLFFHDLTHLNSVVNFEIKTEGKNRRMQLSVAENIRRSLYLP